MLERGDRNGERGRRSLRPHEICLVVMVVALGPAGCGSGADAMDAGRVEDAPAPLRDAVVRDGRGLDQSPHLDTRVDGAGLRDVGGSDVRRDAPIDLHPGDAEVVDGRDEDARAADALGPDAPSRADAAIDVGPPPGIPLPAPWIGRDVGAVGALAGTHALTIAPGEGQHMQLTGGGVGLTGKADAFHFAYQTLVGDGEILGRVTGLAQIDPHSTAGLMIRASLDPDAAMVFAGPVADASAGGGQVVVRKQKGQDAAPLSADPAMAHFAALKTGQWIRLVRQGTTVRILAGTRAEVAGDSGLLGTVTLPVVGTIYFGLAVTSASAAHAAAARFDDVIIDNLATNTTTRDWSSQTFGIAGASAVWQAGSLALAGLGQPWIDMPAREFFAYAYYRPGITAASHTSLQILVAGQGQTDPGGRAALVYRLVASEDDWSRSDATVVLSLTQSLGLLLQMRAIAGEGEPLVTKGAVADLRAPLWLRLDRLFTSAVGDGSKRPFTEVRAFHAPDNHGVPGAWQAVGDPILFQTVGPTDFAALGIAAASFAPTLANTVQISRVVVATVPAPPPVEVDGGSVADAGSQ